jgi:hypothetical protein
MRAVRRKPVTSALQPAAPSADGRQRGLQRRLIHPHCIVTNFESQAALRSQLGFHRAQAFQATANEVLEVPGGACHAESIKWARERLRGAREGIAGAVGL